jgi:hypothetical protein
MLGVGKTVRSGPGRDVKEPAVMMAINRCVAIVKAKEPFLEWAKGLPDPMPGMTLATFHDDAHAYLLPEYATADDQAEILAEFYEEIFVQELSGWDTDEETFPEKRTLAMFEAWFEVEFHSMVLDMIDDEEIEHEPV